MASRLRWKNTLWTQDGKAPGFTLVELLIGAVVASLVVLASYTSYDIQQRSYSVQREAARMEANLRAAMYLIKNDIRNAGRSGEMNGKIGTNDIIAESRRYGDCSGCPGWVDNLDMATGFQGLTLWVALDLVNNRTGNPPADGEADYTRPLSYRRIQYRLWDSDGNGRRELHRFEFDNFGNQIPFGASTLVADGIDDISFAFAYDNTNSGTLDRDTTGGASTIIWAVDGDATPGLDTNLDNDNTGTIDENDAGADDVIDPADGPLGAQIRMQKIRAVRIWIMARSNRTYPKFVNSGIFQVGHKVFKPHDISVANGAGDNTDQFRYLVLSSSVHLRNSEQLDVSQN